MKTVLAYLLAALFVFFGFSVILAVIAFMAMADQFDRAVDWVVMHVEELE